MLKNESGDLSKISNCAVALSNCMSKLLELLLLNCIVTAMRTLQFGSDGQ